MRVCCRHVVGCACCPHVSSCLLFSRLCRRKGHCKLIAYVSFSVCSSEWPPAIDPQTCWRGGSCCCSVLQCCSEFHSICYLLSLSQFTATRSQNPRFSSTVKTCSIHALLYAFDCQNLARLTHATKHTADSQNVQYSEPDITHVLSHAFTLL